MPDVLDLARKRNTLAVEQVAGVLAGIPTIRAACDAMTKAGWRASITWNRITVNDEIFAQFIGATVGVLGSVDARWVIYRIAGTPPVWVVGAESQPGPGRNPARSKYPSGGSES